MNATKINNSVLSSIIMLPLFTLHSIISARSIYERERWNKHGHTACFLQLVLKHPIGINGYSFFRFDLSFIVNAVVISTSHFYADYFSKSYGFRSLPDNNFRGINALSFVGPIYSTFVARQASAVAALLRNNQHKMKTQFSITGKQ